jgi:hypothetical protein
VASGGGVLRAEEVPGRQITSLCWENLAGRRFLVTPLFSFENAIAKEPGVELS